MRGVKNIIQAESGGQEQPTNEQLKEEGTGPATTGGADTANE